MNYADIKQQVIKEYHNLADAPIPSSLLESLLDFLGVSTEVVWELNRAHDRIKCLVHADMDTDYRRYHAVCTVLFDNAPTFLTLAGGREGRDYQQYYALNSDACKAFASYLVSLTLQDLEVVAEDEEIPDLTEFYGVEIQYGAAYTRDNPNHRWLQRRVLGGEL
jgi:hypothetical protein